MICNDLMSTWEHSVDHCVIALCSKRHLYVDLFEFGFVFRYYNWWLDYQPNSKRSVFMSSYTLSLSICHFSNMKLPLKTMPTGNMYVKFQHGTEGVGVLLCIMMEEAWARQT